MGRGNAACGNASLTSSTMVNGWKYHPLISRSEALKRRASASEAYGFCGRHA